MAIDRAAGSDDPWTSAWRRWHKLEAIEYDVVTIGDGVAGAVSASTSSAFRQAGASIEDRPPFGRRLSVHFGPVAQRDRMVLADPHALISAESANR